MEVELTGQRDLMATRINPSFLEAEKIVSSKLRTKRNTAIIASKHE